MYRKPHLMADIRPVRRRAPSSGRPHGQTLFRTKGHRRLIKPRMVSVVLVGVFTVLFASLYVVLFWTNLFRVTEPIVLGNQRVSTESVQAALTPLLKDSHFGVVPGNALLTISPQRVQEQVKQVSYTIEDVQVVKELPNVLKINITERTPRAIWSAAGHFFLVDQQGIAYDEIQRSESRDVSLPVIVDERHRATVELDRVITEQALTFVQQTFTGITRIAGVGINFFIAPSRLAPDLILVTSEGWKVYFDTERTVDEQVETLNTVLKTQVKDRKNLQYIDLRVLGRVFVK